MSLIDKAKQHLQSAAGVAQNAAEAALEAGQTLGAQAQSQLALRKLQIEQARKIHDLGKETYAWHQTGAMTVSSPVPRGVLMLCFQLDDLNEKIDAENRHLEEIKAAAALRAQPNAAPDAAENASDNFVPIPPASSLESAAAPQLPGGAPTRPLPPDDLAP